MDHLQSEQQWNSFLSSLDTFYDDLETNKERSKRLVSTALQQSIADCPSEHTAVLLSGGVDSSLLSLLLKEKGITAITVGTEHSKDMEAAEEVAKSLGIEWKYKLLTESDIEFIVPEVVKILDTTDMIKVSVGIVTYAAAKIAATLGKKHLITGLGSEELFAGYQRHETALADGYPAVHRECWSGLKNMWDRDINRDQTLAHSLDLQIHFPLLSQDMITNAMHIHPMHKITDQQDKILVREVAEDFRLPKDVAYRKKCAAQYGSNVMKLLDKVAKKNGFEYKKEYVESLH